MREINKQSFIDIASNLKLDRPALIEKDYYGVQLLKIIAGIDLEDWILIFAGGTCLAKAHTTDLSRMSEDIDIKFVAKPHVQNESKNKRKNLKKKFKKELIEEIEKNNVFSVIDESSRNEGSNRAFLISYPKIFEHEALRANIKLEFTEIKEPWFTPTTTAVGSIYAQEMDKEPEVLNCRCDTLEGILIEKLISLLRRTAKASRGHKLGEDQALVRHVYDIFFISKHGYDAEKVSRKFDEVVQYDKAQFGNLHTEFQDSPYAELKHGLRELKNNPIHEERYKNFLSPLVYYKNPPTWVEGIKNIESLTSQLFPKVTLAS